MPLQTSTPGGLPPWHSIFPPTQTFTPGAQGGVVLPHVSPMGAGSGSSSVCPSQSLSVPSQTSLPGSLPPWHFHPWGPAQASVPEEHGGLASEPTPVHVAPGGGHHVAVWCEQTDVQLPAGSVQQPGLDGASPSGASSTVPSQSSSSP